MEGWYNSSHVYPIEKRVMTETGPRQALHQYNEAIDFLLRELQRPSVMETIVNIFSSLPNNIWIKEMIIEIEKNPHVELKGVITASGPDQFRSSLSVFLTNLKQYFQGSRSLRIQDIDFEMDRNSIEKGYQNYIIEFRFNLP